MRSDSVGLFWEDLEKVKPPKKEKIKRTPPNRFWESEDYLPGYEEACAYKFDYFTDMELYQAWKAKDRLVYDIEIYPNYCLFSFKSINTGKLVMMEMDGYSADLNREKLRWILENFTLITFNGRFYDIPVSTIALLPDSTCETLWEATCMLIVENVRPHDMVKSFKTKVLKVDQIDLIQLTALAPSLKKCAARLHASKLQDLPFKPGTYLTYEQSFVLKRYNVNDLDNTEHVYRSKLPAIELREEMSKQYNVDLRSDSDAQMAEAIVAAEIKRITGVKYIRPTKIDAGTGYKYTVPKFIKYETPLLNWVLDKVRASTFVVNDWDGGIIMPEELNGLVINIAEGKYKLGIGGLHSQEEKIAHIADDEYFIADTDATSYYPYLILNAGLTPKNLGRDFITVYRNLVDTRVKAKKAGQKLIAECLKIVVNGLFGKLGNMWSVVYAPNLLIQVTITGQLSLLMLVERLELAGIQVTSVNTDGVVAKCHRSKEHTFKAIVKQWETETGFATEEVRYKATYNKDVNNYIAVYETSEKGELFKTKGVYSETSSKKNAVNEVCINAIKEYMTTGKPVEKTIRECKELSMFTTMREVNGGAVKIDGNIGDNTEAVTSGLYLGKVVRWYYSTEAQGDIIYAKTGNKVARTDSAKPCMDLPTNIPDDLDYDWYVSEAEKIMRDVGYQREELQAA